MIVLDLTGVPRQPATCAHCGSRILVMPVDDRLGGERLPRICGTCYTAQERAREMEES